MSPIAWKKIRDDVVACMTAIKAERIRSERRRVLCKRLATLKSVISAARAAPPKRTAADEYKPRFPDLAVMPEVRALVEQQNDAVVDRRSFEALLPNLPAWEQRWRDERTEELRQLFLANSDFETREGVDPLGLARTTFRCKRCRRSCHYPVVLAHECRIYPPQLLATTVDENGNRVPLDAYLYCVLATHPILPLQLEDLEVSPHLADIGKIIALCGKDPSTATRQDMDEADPRLAYDWSLMLGPSVMTWRRAVGRSSYFAVRFCNLTTVFRRSIT